MISVVIPTRNRAALVEKAVRSIRAQPIGEQLEIRVIDNGSTDGTEDRIAALQQDSPVPIFYHRMSSNGGPARSRNFGASQACGDWVAFVDSDVELSPGWLLAALDAFRGDPAVGMITGKVVFASDPAVVHCFGGALSPIGLGWDAHQGESSTSLVERRYSLWTPSASMMVRRTIFDRLGGFDDSYFYGYEDSDLGWRFNLAGWRCLCLPEAVSYHATTEQIDDKTRKTGGELVFHYTKNRLRSLLKNYGAAKLWRYLPLCLAYSAIDAVARAPRLSKLRALWWNLAELRETLRLRRAVQASRRVDDSALDTYFSNSLFPPQPLRRRMKAMQDLHGAASASGRMAS